MNDGSLLAAVRANPADDLPRLVYADWLEETNRPERAAFIRLQVEAAGLHPDSNRRAELEARAEQLLAEHWLDWWGEVCAAVGLPLPERPRATRLGRLARRVVAGDSVGRPYVRHRHTVFRKSFVPGPPDALAGFMSAEYRRGFPDGFHVLEPHGGSVGRWAAALPVAEWTSHPLPGGGAPSPDCPYLATVPRLVLFDPLADELRTFLASPHLTGLSELRVELNDPPGTFAPELVVIAAGPAAPRLRRLEVRLPDQDSAEALAGGGRLAGLTALAAELVFEPDLDDVAATNLPPESDRARLDALARSPHLAGLTKLQVGGVLSPAGVRAVVHDPTWAGLRTLTLTHYWDSEYVDGLADATLPDLIDLRLDAGLTPEAVRRLARLPLLWQLRHLRLTPAPGTTAADVRAVADALDPGRLETLAVRSTHLSPTARAELTHRFGGRVRFA